MAHRRGATFPTRPLGELFRLERAAVIPAASPMESFVYHSIPAFDEFGGPSIEKGANIESNKTLILQPSVLVSKLNPRKSRIAVVDPSGSSLRHCASTEFMAFVPKTSEASLRFFGWYMGSAAFQRRLKQAATGSTNSHVRASPGETLTWQVAFPSPIEQRRIAKILDTLDEAIRRTERIIAKLKQIKQGLLHDLLTRGIDENGELRDPEPHPEKFADSALGVMPRSWNVVSCRSICKEIVVGIVVKPAQYYREHGVPVLRSANVREHGIVLDDLVFMSEANHQILAKSALEPGDLVTVRTGYPGTTAVVPDTLPTANRVDIIISRPGESVRSDYLSLWINADLGKGQILKKQGGLAQQHFNVSEMKRLLVAVPPAEEQTNIADRVEALEGRLRVETAESSKLRLLKHGLMEDLLTGRVRVTNLEAAA
jgi:type I restriction enzyme, S subunit